MKRDMELVRELLIQIEEHDSKDEINFFVEEGYKFTNQEIDYHLELMISAGLIKGSARHTSKGTVFDIESLTWIGHEFLDAARNDKVWEKAEKTVEKNGMSLRSLPLEVKY